MIFLKNKNRIQIKGTTYDFMTELEFIKRDGIIIPFDTGIKIWEKEGKNSIDTGLTCHLAHRIAANTNNYALDNLFGTQGTRAAEGATNAGKDGIVHWDKLDLGQVEHFLLTVLNVGGTGGQGYSEFYGYINGAVTLNHYLGIGYNYVNSGPYNMTVMFAENSISTTVAINRRFHRYWKFTLS